VYFILKSLNLIIAKMDAFEKKRLLLEIYQANDDLRVCQVKIMLKFQ